MTLIAFSWDLPTQGISLSLIIQKMPTVSRLSSTSWVIPTQLDIFILGKITREWRNQWSCSNPPTRLRIYTHKIHKCHAVNRRVFCDCAWCDCWGRKDNIQSGNIITASAPTYAPFQSHLYPNNNHCWVLPSIFKISPAGIQSLVFVQTWFHWLNLRSTEISVQIQIKRNFSACNTHSQCEILIAYYFGIALVPFRYTTYEWFKKSK